MRDETIADLLLARLGDHRPGLLCHDRTRTWDEVVRESAARASLARALREDGRPFHIGVLLDNVPEYVLWLGAAALAGATVAGINPTRRGAHLEQEVRHTDLQLVVTDKAGAALLDGLDIGVPEDRFLRVDLGAYACVLAGHQVMEGAEGAALRDPAITPRPAGCVSCHDRLPGAVDVRQAVRVPPYSRHATERGPSWICVSPRRTSGCVRNFVPTSRVCFPRTSAAAPVRRAWAAAGSGRS